MAAKLPTVESSALHRPYALDLFGTGPGILLSQAKIDWHKANKHDPHCGVNMSYLI